MIKELLRHNFIVEPGAWVLIFFGYINEIKTTTIPLTQISNKDVKYEA